MTREKVVKKPGADGRETATDPRQAATGQHVVPWGRTTGRPTAFWLSGTTLLLIVAAALLAPVIAPHDPLALNLLRRLQPPPWSTGGSITHPLGTDELGRDVFSRIVYGTRTSLTVSSLAIAVGTVLGSGLGLVAGWRRGVVDAVAGRVADIQQALPFIVFVLAVTAAAGPSFANVVLVLGVGSWVVHFRIVRGATLKVRELPYIEAARAVGHSDFGIVWRHVLPNVLPVIVVNVTSFVPQLMLFEAALSFLGMGIPPPAPTWGGMIAAGRTYVEVAWWISVFPGLALLLTVAAVHGLGEGLNRRLNPKEH